MKGKILGETPFFYLAMRGNEGDIVRHKPTGKYGRVCGGVVREITSDEQKDLRRPHETKRV